MSRIVIDGAFLPSPYLAVSNQIVDGIENVVVSVVGPTHDLCLFPGRCVGAANRGCAKYVVKGSVLQDKQENVLDAFIQVRLVKLARDKNDPEQDPPDEPEDD